MIYDEKTQALAKKDFRVFLKLTWNHLGLPSPTPMQYDIADYLQQEEERLVVQALRGIGKTWITGAYVTWRLYKNPNEKVLIVSQSGSHARNISIFIRRLIDTMPLVTHLKPNKVKGHRTSFEAFDVAGCNIAVQPSVKALGITGQLQGNRATLLISDDVEGLQNSLTESARETLIAQVGEYEAIKQTDDNAQIIVLGTPQSVESIYTNMREKGYRTRIWTAQYPENLEAYQGCLAPMIAEAVLEDPSLAGKTTDTRFTDEDLMSRRASFGDSKFKLQFMLDTTLSDSERYPLKLKDLIVTSLPRDKGPIGVSWSGDKGSVIKDIENLGFTGDVLHSPLYIDKEFTKYEGVMMAIDPSGRGADETGYAIVATLHGNLFVLDVGGLTGGYTDETLMTLALKAKEYDVGYILVEANFGDGTWTELFKPILKSVYPVTIEEERAYTNKERRIIDTLEPILNQHRLVIDRGVVEKDVKEALSDVSKLKYSLIHQLTHITKDSGSLKHDDRLDALSSAVSYWRNTLAQDVHDSLQAHKERQMDEWIQHVIAVNTGRREVTDTILDPELTGYESASMW